MTHEKLLLFIIMEENEMRDFVRESYDLLSQESWKPSISAMEKIINAWGRNKEALMEVFRKSPNWVEEDKMIRFSNNFTRELDRGVITGFYYWVRNQFNCDEWMSDDNRRNILARISGLDTTLKEEEANAINQFDSSLRATVGQKSSRAINKLLTKIGLNKHPEYNKIFAQFSDAINPLTVSRHTCLSVNPIDFLNMSNGNSWTSCHRVFEDDGEYGCYCSGTISYMMDSSSFIFYTVDESYSGDDITYAPKLNRQVFNYSHDKIVQGRLYPQSCDSGCNDNYTEIRNLVQKIIADCLEMPNMWIKTPISHIYVETASGATHYPDYIHFSNCSVSRLKDSLDGAPVLIGSVPYCIECGDRHENEGSLSCCSAAPNEDSVRCEDCGYLMDRDNAVWVESADGYFCEDCATFCDVCECYHRESDVEYVDSTQQYVCRECLEEYFIECDCCGKMYDKEHLCYIESEEVDVCIECLDDKYMMCTECGEYFSVDDVTEIDGDYYCTDCRDENFVRCNHCGEYVVSIIETDNESVCEDCLEENYTVCEGCGAYISNDEIYEYDGEPYCETCLNEVIDNSEEEEIEEKEEEVQNV